MSSTTTLTTRFATSADGTEIAYEVTGSGPALVLVDGALCQRAMGPSRGLAKELAGSFTVYAYDRRGRGESGPGDAPYALGREIEDLVAVIQAAGGRAHVLGRHRAAPWRWRPPATGPPSTASSSTRRRSSSTTPARRTTRSCHRSCRTWSTTVGAATR
jgi:hypothetical protein